MARATSKLSTTRTGQLKGKLAYMAPEQARGAKDIDRRADIFAAGVVLWEALEGRRLFKGDGEADTLNKVLYEPIPPLEDAVRSVPHEIEIALEGALDRERMRRFPTAAAFADALERAARETGDGRDPQGRGGVSRRDPRRRDPQPARDGALLDRARRAEPAEEPEHAASGSDRADVASSGPEALVAGVDALERERASRRP